MLEIVRKDEYTYTDVENIMALLRSEDGCPWDREQTHESIKRNFIEEVYEAVEAIELGDKELLKEELGDVLLQVVFHGQIAKQAGDFTMEDVFSGLCRKLIERHPHIFGGKAVCGSEEVLQNWEDIKNVQKNVRTTAHAMERVAKSLPALIRAEKVQAKAQKTGFDFPDISGALQKAEEELLELRAAKTQAEAEEELGDLLFAAVNVARFLHVDPEALLHKATDKFTARFAKMEQAITASGQSLDNVSLRQMESVWQEIKSR